MKTKTIASLSILALVLALGAFILSLNNTFFSVETNIFDPSGEPITQESLLECQPIVGQVGIDCNITSSTTGRETLQISMPEKTEFLKGQSFQQITPSIGTWSIVVGNEDLDKMSDIVVGNEDLDIAFNVVAGNRDFETEIHLVAGIPEGKGDIRFEPMGRGQANIVVGNEDVDRLFQIVVGNEDLELDLVFQPLSPTEAVIRVMRR